MKGRGMSKAWVVLVLLVLVAGAGCSSGSSPSAGSSPSPTASASSPTATPAPAPVVGECHQLDVRTAGQPEDSSAPVPCQGPHTSQTIKVGSLQAVAGSDATTDEAQDQVARACGPRLLRRVGGDEVARRLSRFEVVWFTPTADAVKAGADWFRCDVVALAAEDSLVRLPRTVVKALDQPQGLDEFGTCGTTAPGKKGFARVVCRRAHTWRAVDTVDLDRNARYLGKAAAAQGDTACKDVAAARANGALKYTWSFEWPTQDLWNAGQRYGYCWVPEGAAG
jgi:hypothetical protein